MSSYDLTLEAKLPLPRSRATSPAGFEWPLIRSLICLAIVALFVAADWAQGFSRLTTAFGDTDDATRLVQVREWLAGAGWYDLILPRFGGPTPLVSHWSRLIDLPIAGLITLFNLMMPMESAELAARVAWPSLLMLVLLMLLSREADLREGRAAALLTLALLPTTLSCIFQFMPGRIDHHSVMILGTVTGILAFARSTQRPKLGWIAGAALGLALTIGYEPLAFILPMAGLAALAALLQPAWLAAIRSTLTGLWLALVAGLAVTSPIALWHLAPCDAIGLNVLALAAAPVLPLWLVATLGKRCGPGERIGIAVVCGIAGISLAYLLNPTCANGPFGGVSADAKALWLVHVQEGKPLWETAKTNPLTMLVFAITAFAGVFGAWRRWREAGSFDSGVMLIAMTALAVLGVLMMKYMAYASVFASLCIALALARLRDSASLSRIMKQTIGVGLVNQFTLILVAMALAPEAAALSSDPSSSTACLTRQAISPLSNIPKGLVVAPIDVGPSIVAMTALDVLAAPYHRIDAAIAANELIFRAKPTDARERLAAVGATYLAACLPLKGSAARRVAPGSLLAALQAGERIPFLEPATEQPADAPLKVWRIVR